MKMLIIILGIILFILGLQTARADYPVEQRNQLSKIAESDGMMDGCSFGGRVGYNETEIRYQLSCGMAVKVITFNAETMTYKRDMLTVLPESW